MCRDSLSSLSSHGGRVSDGNDAADTYSHIEPRDTVAAVMIKEVPASALSTRTAATVPAVTLKFRCILYGLSYVTILTTLLCGRQFARLASETVLDASQSKRMTEYAPIGDFALNGFAFYVIGDAPYTVKEEKLLVEQVDRMTRYSDATDTEMEFIVHVGDIQKPRRTRCAVPYYRFIADILGKAHLPIVLVHGDNDWYDCEDQQGRFDLFTSIFSRFYRHWGSITDADGVRNIDRALPMMEHDAKNGHHFSFFKQGVLFVGINLVNMPSDDRFYEPMMEAAKGWIETTFSKYVENDGGGRKTRGVVVIGHSGRSPNNRAIFEYMSTYMVPYVDRRTVPLIYLHGDGHKWDINVKLRDQLDWPHMTDVQVDQLGVSDPVVVEVAPVDANGSLVPLQQLHDWQVVLGDGLIRFDRRRGDWRRKPRKTAAEAAPDGDGSLEAGIE